MKKLVFILLDSFREVLKSWESEGLKSSDVGEMDQRSRVSKRGNKWFSSSVSKVHYLVTLGAVSPLGCCQTGGSLPSVLHGCFNSSPQVTLYMSSSPVLKAELWALTPGFHSPPGWLCFFPEAFIIWDHERGDVVRHTQVGMGYCSAPCCIPE